MTSMLWHIYSKSFTSSFTHSAHSHELLWLTVSVQTTGE